MFRLPVAPGSPKVGAVPFHFMAVRKLAMGSGAARAVCRPTCLIRWGTMVKGARGLLAAWAGVHPRRWRGRTFCGLWTVEIGSRGYHAVSFLMPAQVRLAGTDSQAGWLWGFVIARISSGMAAWGRCTALVVIWRGGPGRDQRRMNYDVCLGRCTSSFYLRRGGCWRGMMGSVRITRRVLARVSGCGELGVEDVPICERLPAWRVRGWRRFPWRHPAPCRSRSSSA